MSTAERRIRRPAEREELLKELVVPGVFDRMADALAFAASLGFARGVRKPFEQSGEQIRVDVFENRGYGALPDLIALAATQDPEILADDAFDKRAKVFEEFANGGLELIQGRLAQELTALDCIINLVQENRQLSEPGSGLSDQLRRLVDSD